MSNHAKPIEYFYFCSGFTFNMIYNNNNLYNPQTNRNRMAIEIELNYNLRKFILKMEFKDFSIHILSFEMNDIVNDMFNSYHKSIRFSDLMEFWLMVIYRNKDNYMMMIVDVGWWCTSIGQLHCIVIVI